MFEQILRVRSNETDGDESGRHWTVHYVLFEAEDGDGNPSFDLYTDDSEGNGSFICSGGNRNKMVSLTLRLGAFLEWRKK